MNAAVIQFPRQEHEPLVVSSKPREVFVARLSRDQRMRWLEESPHHRTIILDKDIFDDEERDSDYIVPLAMPYVVYAVTEKLVDGRWMFKDLRVYFRNSPVKSLDSKLYQCPLPNVNDHGRVCLGSLTEDVQMAGLDVVTAFWTSAFTETNSRLGQLRRWISRSQDRSFDGTSLRWKLSPSTVSRPAHYHRVIHQIGLAQAFVGLIPLAMVVTLLYYFGVTHADSALFALGLMAAWDLFKYLRQWRFKKFWPDEEEGD